MTQKEKILAMLQAKEWVHSDEFYKAYMPSFNSVINKLRKEDHYVIEIRPSGKHKSCEYSLLGKEEDVIKCEEKMLLKELHQSTFFPI